MVIEASFTGGEGGLAHVNEGFAKTRASLAWSHGEAVNGNRVLFNVEIAYSR